jgi:ABC-type branched-subunit amino acid transport system ATPase component
VLVEQYLDFVPEVADRFAIMERRDHRHIAA